jgi:uncharacterized protein DUF3106
MRMWSLRIAIAVVVVCGVVSPIAAQQKKPPKPSASPKPAAGKPSAGKPPAGFKNPQVKAVQDLDRFSKMSPEDREKALSKLPPQRRAVFEQRLARYEQMTPEQREHVQQRVEQMESLPKERQNAIRQEIQRMNALPFAQRKKVLAGEDFKQRFSPDEQKLVLGAFPNIEKQLKGN